jgi:hypothetical protein
MGDPQIFSAEPVYEATDTGTAYNSAMYDMSPNSGEGDAGYGGWRDDSEFEDTEWT